MRALITGISGFVGSHLAEFLLRETDWQIAGTVYGHLDNIAHLRDRVTFYPAELSRLEVVRFILDETRPDFIFHLAAQPIPALSRLDPWFTLENNIRAQLNVLESVVQLGLAARVLVVGSSEAYGQVKPDELPIDEDTPMRPTNAYGVSKMAQDFLGLQYFLSSQVEVVRVRPFNHIGPRQRQGFVAPDFACQIALIEAGKCPPVVQVGNLDAERDFSDVRDIVRGYYLALTRGRAGEVYNLGSEQAYAIQYILDTLIRLSGRPVRVVLEPSRMRALNVPKLMANCTKLRTETGWRTTMPLEQSLADVLDYWRGQVACGATDPTPLELRADLLRPPA